MFPSINLRGTAYWEATLYTGRKVSGIERTKVTERDRMLKPELKDVLERSIDWTLDLVSTGDVLKIKELSVVAPGVHLPGVLKVTEPGTVFQFKNVSATTGAFGVMDRIINALVIGRVDNKETGACTCWIWDRELGLFPYKSNITDFGTWHPRIAPIHGLAHDVIGLRL